MGNLDAVRQLRTQVHSYFCLPEQMWLEWLSDERLAAATETKSSSLLHLYDTCLQDYFYEKVCYKYLKYVAQSADLPVENKYERFQRVVRIYGLGGQRACKIWRLFAQTFPASAGSTESAEEDKRRHEEI